MEMLVQLLIGIVPAIISGFVAYFTAINKGRTEIRKVEKESEARIKDLKEKVDADLKSYEGKLNADSINNLTMKAFEGDFDFEKLGDSLEQLSKLEKQVENYKKGKYK